MQITAFQDPISGNLFQTKDLLDAFQAEQAAAEKFRLDQAAARVRLAELQTYLVLNMETPEDLAKLASKVYIEYLELAYTLSPLKRGRKPVKVKLVSIEAYDYALASKYSDTPPGMKSKFSATLKVVLSTEPNYAYDTRRPDSLGIRTVLGGVQIHGGGCSSNDDGTYSMRYGIEVPLDVLPKMTERIRVLKALNFLRSDHQRKLETAKSHAIRHDSEAERLRSVREAARIALNAALVAKDNADFQLEEREMALNTGVVEKSPFESQEEWDANFLGFEKISDLVTDVDGFGTISYM